MDAIRFLLATSDNPGFREDLMSAYGRLGHFVPAESAVVSPRAREIRTRASSVRASGANAKRNRATRGRSLSAVR